MRITLASLTVILLLGGCKVKSDLPNLTSGTIDRLENFGSGIVTPRNVDVWLPDGYSTDIKYPVIYMHDGQMLFDASKTWNKQAWDVDDVVGKLIEDGEIEPVIIVGIWNISEERDLDYIPSKPLSNLDPDQLEQDEAAIVSLDLRSDDYLEFIVKELKPYIDKTYSVRSDMDNTFIMGSSKGGLISMYAISEHPDVFGGAACLSTHWPGSYNNNKPIPDAFRDYLATKASVLEGKKLYFDRGTETLDAIYPYGQNIIDEIFMSTNTSNIEFESLVFEGQAHDEISWSERLDIPIKFLLGK